MIDVSAGNRYYYFCDGLGSVVALLHNSAVVEMYFYDAFGRTLIYKPETDEEPEDWDSRSSFFGNRFMFTGREYDAESRLYYYRARMYHPGIGRFLQTDPIGYADSMNLYAYCLNNPVNWTDPTGQGIFKWLYTGDWNASDEVYNAATEAAASFLLDVSPVRGGYASVGKSLGNVGGIGVGVEVGVSWSMDDGTSIAGGLVIGKNQRGRDSNTGQFVSEYAGGFIGGQYNLDEKSCSFAASGGIASSQNGQTYRGGVHLGYANDNTFCLGLNYGLAGAGLIIQPSKFDDLGHAWADMLSPFVESIFGKRK